MPQRIPRSTFYFLTSGFSLPCIFFTLLFLGASHAVTITMDENLPAGMTNICENISPGICCKAITFSNYCYFNPFNPTSVRFDDLLVNDIATVWGLRNGLPDPDPIRDCSGTLIETRTGMVGSWYYPAPGAQRAYGASYIRLPLKLPPSESESRWLAVEGMLGLVWGGGKWFAQGAETVIGQGVGLKKHRDGGRKILTGKEGTAYLRGPQSWRWPDHIVLNGTKYSSLDTGGLRYRSADGAVLDMTATQEHC